MNENKIDYSKLTISQADLAKYTFSKPPSNIIFYDTSTGNQREVMRITKDGVTSNPDVSVDEGAKAIIRALDGYIKNLVKESLAKQEQRSDSEQLSTECVSVSVGEPVAWYIRDKDSATTDGCWAEKNLDICEPLYTTPPQRKPLTAEQIKGLVFDAGYIQAEETADFINGIRHGEAAHGIKE